jgi:small subunit ribosomal protein S9
MSSGISCFSTGRRKSAVARMRVLDGSGRIRINGKTLGDYFCGLDRLEKMVLKTFDVWTGAKNYDFYVNVNGGGVSGQAGAIRHSLARAILKLDESSKVILKKEGFLTRDSRSVERKKPGRAKARKRFQFSKR